MLGYDYLGPWWIDEGGPPVWKRAFMGTLYQYLSFGPNDTVSYWTEIGPISHVCHSRLFIQTYLHLDGQ
jgi:hypothetical protein